MFNKIKSALKVSMYSLAGIFLFYTGLFSEIEGFSDMQEYLLRAGFVVAGATIILEPWEVVEEDE